MRYTITTLDRVVFANIVTQTWQDWYDVEHKYPEVKNGYEMFLLADGEPFPEIGSVYQ